MIEQVDLALVPEDELGDTRGAAGTTVYMSLGCCYCKGFFSGITDCQTIGCRETCPAQ